MLLATATDIEQWADERKAQSQLPQLVRQLVSTTAKGLIRLSMRSGEGVGLPGWDGIAVAMAMPMSLKGYLLGRWV